MIDLVTEHPLSILAATAFVPSSRRDKQTHPSRLTRWITEGIEGPNGRVRLRALRAGGSWITSKEALQEFFEKLTPRDPNAPPSVRAATARKRAHEQAERELDAAGIK